MKKLAVFIVASVFSFAVNAQDVSKKAQSLSLEKVVQGKSAGVFEFTFPADITAEQVKEKAAYYTQYFTVDFAPSTGKVTIKMVENVERSRMVIMRFFVANDIREIVMDGSTYTVEKFYNDFLK